MANDYLERFANRLKERAAVATMGDWICANTTRAGNKFSFTKYPFQKAIADDMHPSVCVKKLSQVGLSEINYRKMIGFLARNKGVTGLYTYPDLVMKKIQAQTRIKPIFDNDFPARKEDIRNNDVMQLNDSFLYISANTESSATSTAVDFIMNDEYDLSNQEFLALVNSRIQGSDYKIKHGFSTPTFSGYGISLEYESSDKREYFYKCEHCGHWQVPLYDRAFVHIPGLPDEVTDLKTELTESIVAGLDLDNAYVFCEKCGKPIKELSNGDRREWVAEFPDRYTHGYWVRPFSSSVLSIRYLVTTMADFIKKNEIRRGINTVLGEEYSDSQTRLDKSAIIACMKESRVPEINSATPVFIGIDMGSSCHIVLSTSKRHAFYFTAVPPEALKPTVEELCKKYNIVYGAIDRYPYTPTSNEIRDMSNRRIFPIEYSYGKTVEPVKEVAGEISYYRANRTNALDLIMQGINSGFLELYGYTTYQNVLIEHLRDMFRDDSNADKQPIWKKIRGNDHFFHALAYSFIAIEIGNFEIGLNETKETREWLDFGGAQKELYNDDLLEYSNRRFNNTIRKRW